MSYGDEYYCPNCGATLNDQYGFDADKGSWTCTECGQHLMDDDIYDGDTFEGVEWRCDCCNDLLNRQHGFSDSLGFWTCTECGYTNDITEDNIIDECSIIRCPNCYGVLNNQFGFNKYDNDCECAFCGAKLHQDYSNGEYKLVEEKEEYSLSGYTSPPSYTSSGYSYSDYDRSSTTHGEHRNEVQKFYCPSCGSLLNNQYEFNHKSDEYTCKVCDTLLYHYYLDEPYKVNHTRERTTHTSSTYTQSKEPYSTVSHKNTSKSSKSNDWLLFFLCLFFGYFGVHKFAEGKVGMGILYIFTVGLFYIGWVVDIVKYFIRAIK